MHLFCAWETTHPEKPPIPLALGQIQAVTHTITQTTHTALQSLNGATLTLRERGGVGVVGDEQVGFFGGDGACVDGVAEEAVYGFGGGVAVGGGVGEGEGGVGGGVFGVDGVAAWSGEDSGAAC